MNEKKYLTFPIVILAKHGLNIKDSLNEVMEYCLYDNMVRHYEKSLDAAKRMGITFPILSKAVNKGIQLYDSIDDKAVKTSISRDMIFDFYKNTKTDFEIITFLAFAAIRTILQKQAYIKITNDYLLSRMSGNNKKGDLADFLKPYSTRYQLDKIKTELQLNWGLKLYSIRSRGYYVSFKVHLSDLVLLVEKSKANRRLKKQQLETQKKSARTAALSTINQQLDQQPISSYK